jgi:FdhE protein
VRQGEVASKGSWTGNPLGGVKAPEPLILPDLATKFARTAARLQVRSAGHPMQAWLRFMARLARAQHDVAVALGPLPGPGLAGVEQAVAARMPPYAADGHRRDPAWRDGLTTLLDRFTVGDAACQTPVEAASDEAIWDDTLPAPALAAIAGLRDRGEASVEAFADGFLHGGVDDADAGAVLYVAAALQVYFTRLAAGAHAPSLRLLPQRGLCPCCGSTPVAGLITGAGQAPGARYLHCSLCGTAWNHVRAACITCGESGKLTLQGIEDDDGAVKAEVCGACRTYAKMLYQARDMQLDPVADDLATLGLDILMAEAGWSRHATNPLLLIG